MDPCIHGRRKKNLESRSRNPEEGGRSAPIHLLTSWILDSGFLPLGDRQRWRVLGSRGYCSKQLLYLIRGHRLVEKESLIDVAAHGAENSKLLFGLDALGHHFQLQAVRQSDDASHHGGGSTVGVVEILHEGAIDLEAVHREIPELAQGRVSGPEVVDGEPHS